MGFALAFGLFAPVFTRLMLATPPAFIGALAGLAMLRVLQTAFNVSFRERFTLGALVTFLVTVADVPIFNVGAPFWGLVIGYAVSRLLERKDFAAAAPCVFPPSRPVATSARLARQLRAPLTSFALGSACANDPGGTSPAGT